MTIIGDRYNIIAPIDQNENRDETNSGIFVAKDLKDNNKVVALKILRIDENKEKDIKQELFKREYTSLSRLNHKSIIKFIRYGKEEEKLFLVMEYFDAVTLNKYIHENNLIVEDKLSIAIRIAEALAYAHEKDVVHRDLKPDNILVNNPEDIKVIDFGISKIINAKYESENTVKCCMTIRYAAPEQLLRFEPKIQNDIYSFGLNLAFILSEEEPPEDKSKISDYIDKIECSTGLKELIYSLVNKDSEKRIQSMYTVKRELEKEYNIVRSKTKKLYIKFDPFIQRKLYELGSLDYTNAEHTKKFLKEDLSESYIFRDVKRSTFHIIGKSINYTCKMLKNNNGLSITYVNFIDDHIVWEQLSRKGIPINLAWIPIENENDAYNDSYLTILIQEIIDSDKTREVSRSKNIIKNELLEKWNRYLQEEFSEIDNKKKIAIYNDFELDETGYKLLVSIKELDYELKINEPIQMTDENDCQITVGEFEERIDNKICVRLKMDINPNELSKKGVLGIDIKQIRSNLRKMMRALNAIKYSESANPNLADILAEPSVINMNKKVLINPDDFYQVILKQSPESANANAVKKALGTKDLFLIQGPPGTGKSTVITEIICQILKNNVEDKILLASQSNVAVDHVVNKVAELLSDKRIIRIGRSNKISVQAQNLILSEQLNKWVLDVKQKSLDGTVTYINRVYKIKISKEILINILDNDIDKMLDDNAYNFDDYEKEKFKKLIILTKEWHRRLGKLDEFDEIFANRASIIAATCVGIASRNVLNDMDFDWVIVDEAARATPLELLVPLVRGKKIILVGDHMQLPPVVNTELSKIKLEERGIRESDLEKSLFEDLYEKISEDAKLVLSAQFRMHPDISSLISDIFYPSVNISTTIEKKDRNHDLIWWPKCIKWIDTSTQSKNDEKEELLSKKNSCEAKIILQELEKIESRYRQIDKKDATVAIISGYDAQKNLLTNLIKPEDKAKWRNIKILIDNVDAFQGSETDIVVYSLVRCNPEYKIGFLSDERRLNVALSRGRSCLIIVGNIKFAERAKSFRGNPFVDIIKFIRKNSCSCLIEVYDAN